MIQRSRTIQPTAARRPATTATSSHPRSRPSSGPLPRAAASRPYRVKLTGPADRRSENVLPTSQIGGLAAVSTGTTIAPYPTFRPPERYDTAD